MGEFFLFFEMFVTFLMEMMEKKNETELLTALRQKGRHELFAMTACLRQKTKLRGWRLARKRRWLWGEYNAMSDEDLCMVVLEAVELRAERLAGDVAPSSPTGE